MMRSGFSVAFELTGLRCEGMVTPRRKGYSVSASETCIKRAHFPQQLEKQEASTI